MGEPPYHASTRADHHFREDRFSGIGSAENESGYRYWSESMEEASLMEQMRSQDQLPSQVACELDGLPFNGHFQIMMSLGENKALF